MTNCIVLAFVVLILAVLVILSEHYYMRHYWRRACTGRLWRRSFPNTSKAELRTFLDLFTAAFGFSECRRLSFAPDDRVKDIYRTLYPNRGIPDAMELETLVEELERRYGLDVTSTWNENITLGDLFARTRRSPECPISNR